MIICDEQMNYLNGSDTYKILNNLCKEKRINKIPFVICSSNKENNNTFSKSLHLVSNAEASNTAQSNSTFLREFHTGH